jgi:hypothetical protein
MSCCAVVKSFCALVRLPDCKQESQLVSPAKAGEIGLRCREVFRLRRMTERLKLLGVIMAAGFRQSKRHSNQMPRSEKRPHPSYPRFAELCGEACLKNEATPAIIAQSTRQTSPPMATRLEPSGDKGSWKLAPDGRGNPPGAPEKRRATCGCRLSGRPRADFRRAKSSRRPYIHGLSRRRYRDEA